jgi:hypothetical protein
MRKRGVRFTAAWGRQAFKIGGKFKFWGGLTIEAVGGGPGLVESETQLARKAGSTSGTAPARSPWSRTIPACTASWCGIRAGRKS